MLHFNTGTGAGTPADGSTAEGLATTTVSASGGAATVSAPSETSVWKVLVLDATGQRILSPIMKVNDLRDHGVTLYL